jgi:hypothetical protein
MTRAVVLRIAISILAGLALALVFNELTFRFLRTEEARGPQVIELVIPPGTAELVARGEDSPSIPADMLFVVGDTLVVRNNDDINHQLGPLFIPAGSSASLTFDTVQDYAYACSFQTGRYLGLDVREPLTIETRILGTLFAGLPLGALLALYSLVAWPTKKG